MKCRSVDDVLECTRKNLYRKWGGLYEDHDDHCAARRLATLGPATIKIDEPKFKISPDSGVFTIGSCFARHIEISLMKQGIDILSRDFDIPQALCEVNASQVLNKYTPHALACEINNVFATRLSPGDHLICVGDDQYFDLSATGLRPSSWDTSLATRHKLDAAFGRIREASFIIITLGLTESWLDNETGLFCNRAPTPKILMKNKSRFSFFNADVHDVYETLCSTFETIIGNLGNGIRIIVTVSPVPLLATFTRRDVITANAYSKGVLRVAADMLADTFDWVDYFPSYEMVVNSPVDFAMERDRRHVRMEMVDVVTAAFLQNYFEARA